MWVCSSGWNDEVMATPLVKSRPAPERAGSQDGLRVRPGELAQPGRQAGQRPVVADGVQELLGPEGAGREDDLLGA